MAERKSMTAARIAGDDSGYHRRDLYEAAERGENPRSALKVRIMPETGAETSRINPSDLTTVWPCKDSPLIEVGVPGLDRNPH